MINMNAHEQAATFICRKRRLAASTLAAAGTRLVRIRPDRTDRAAVRAVVARREFLRRPVGVCVRLGN